MYVCMCVCVSVPVYEGIYESAVCELFVNLLSRRQCSTRRERGKFERKSKKIKW